MQAEPTTKSRPIYPPVEIGKDVAQHLFIAETGAFSALSDLYGSCSSERSCWIVGEPESNSLGKYPKGCHFVRPADMTDVFSKLFSELPISSNIYLSAFRESFLWDMHNLATKAGMAEEQIKKLKPLSNERRLFCTHCYTVTEGVTHTPFQCPGCDRLLLVRDHFSRIHGAYVGVQINAEDPKDIPETQELN